MAPHFLARMKKLNSVKELQRATRAAVNKLVKANLRFVISVAKQFHGPGIELGDLIQAGNMGIIIAAERFDHTKGFKFISYAVWWIRQKIMEHLQQEKIIRMPGNAIMKLSRSKQQAEKRMQKINNGVFSFEEEEEEPGMSFRFGHVSKYLSDPVGKDESDTFEDLLSSSQTEQDNLTKQDLTKTILRILKSKLDKRESFIIRHRFGINCQPMLLEDIGENLGISRERARQIETIALDKLKRNSGLLKQFLN
jgi:RNA polymerase primary sigma factor